MTNIPVDTVGWTQLMDGNMTSAVYTMFDTRFGSMGLIVVILFIVYQFMLYWKTQNLTLMWIVGLMFASLYAANSVMVTPFSLKFIFFILVFEFAGILYLLLFSKS